MMTMGLPPKYGKAPAEMTLSGRKRGSPASWLNVEGPGSTSDTTLMPPPRTGLPPIHRRSASESFADNLFMKESHFFNAVAASSSKTHDNQTTKAATTSININIDGKNMSINKEEDLGKKKSSSLPPLPPLPPLPSLGDDSSNKKKKVQINEEIISSSSAAFNINKSTGTEMKTMNNSTSTNNIDFTQYKWGRKFDPNMDPKKIKRILANRLSAQKSRLKKLEYKAELEKTVDALQTEIGVLSPQVCHIDRQRFVLRMENAAMKQKMAHLMNDKRLKEAQFRALKEETEKLKQLYIMQQQNIKKEQQEKEQQQNYNVNQINMDFLNCLI